MNSKKPAAAGAGAGVGAHAEIKLKREKRERAAQRQRECRMRKKAREAADCNSDAAHSGAFGGALREPKLKGDESSEVGKGSFGTVSKAAVASAAKATVAVKIIRCYRGPDKRQWQKDQVADEVRAQTMLKAFLNNKENERYRKHHLPIVVLISSEWSPCGQELRMLFPLVAHDQYKNFVGGMNTKDIANFAFQLFKALEVLHAAGIIHQDLKPDNVLYSSETKQLQVCDLGLAVLRGDTRRVAKTQQKLHVIQKPETLRGFEKTVWRDCDYRCGTKGWQAPEQVLKKAMFVCETLDIFSAGLMILAVVLERPTHRLLMIDQSKENDYVSNLATLCGRNKWELLRQRLCVQTDASKVSWENALLRSEVALDQRLGHMGLSWKPDRVPRSLWTDLPRIFHAKPWARPTATEVLKMDFVQTRRQLHAP